MCNGFVVIKRFSQSCKQLSDSIQTIASCVFDTMKNITKKACNITRKFFNIIGNTTKNTSDIAPPETKADRLSGVRGRIY